MTLSVVVNTNSPVLAFRVPIAHKSMPDAGDTQAYSIVQLESEVAYKAVKEVGP